MAEEEQVVQLRDNFYRDCFTRIMLIVVAIGAAIVILIGLSIYLYIEKPTPKVFKVQDNWHIQREVPVNQPYLSSPDLLQWVSDVVPSIFVYDFNYYNTQLKSAAQYFTKEGWKIFLNQLNNYANYNTVQTNRMFVNGSPAGAPFILSKGLLSGRYAWWVRVPLNIQYAGFAPLPSKTLTLQILVVRVPTRDNLMGVAIDNVIVANAKVG